VNGNTDILEIKDLKTSFFTDEGEVKAVDGVSFGVAPGRTLGLVGESGCGKTVASLSILRLIPEPPGRIMGGKIFYKGADLLTLGTSEMRKIRGREISMIFQEPMTSLNPVFTIGNQISEAIALHQHPGRAETRRRAIEMLQMVGIPAPEKRMTDYPHQLSGGMRQRVMIAMALSCNPGVLIADEPTTALDVTIQAQILELLKDLQKRVGMAMILITHDLGVVAEMADDVAVMYAGRIVEQGPVAEIFKHPRHPYTAGLLRSLPRLGAGRKRLEAIPGLVPSLMNLPRACRFADRCNLAGAECTLEEPSLRTATADSRHVFRCVRDL